LLALIIVYTAIHETRCLYAEALGQGESKHYLKRETGIL